jgi:hypothetical protein
MPFVSVLPQDAVGCDTSDDGYYDEAKGRSDNTGRKPISARDAHRCWTSAMRTSENSVITKFSLPHQPTPEGHLMYDKL